MISESSCSTPVRDRLVAELRREESERALIAGEYLTFEKTHKIEFVHELAVIQTALLYVRSEDSLATACIKSRTESKWQEAK